MLLFSLTSVASAQRTELARSGPIDRPSAQSASWCPCEEHAAAYSFVADGADALVKVGAKTHDFNGSFMFQRLDNVALVRPSTFAAHFGDITEPICGGLSTIRQLFIDDIPPGELVYLETFDTGDGGWDTSGGWDWLDPATPGEFDPSAWTDANDPSTNGGGSLQAGAESDPPGFIETEIVMLNLTAGQEYILSCWWKSNGDEGPDSPDMEIIILGSEQPVSNEVDSWGSVKALYDN